MTQKVLRSARFPYGRFCLPGLSPLLPLRFSLSLKSNEFLDRSNDVRAVFFEPFEIALLDEKR